MPEGAEIIQEIQTHFARYPQPEDFINRFHCCECAEHYQELLNVPVEEIQFAHVENQAWDATCFLSPDGFRYYFPGLARVADQHREEWLDVLVGRLGLHYVETFNAEDRRLVRRLLEYWYLCEDVSERDRAEIGRVLDAWHSQD